MSNLQALRQRISSIQATKKITSAMKLIATSHFKKLQKTHQESKSYVTHFHQAFQDVVHHKDLNQDLSPLTKQRPVKKHLILLMGSDRGLCGGFNMTLAKYVLGEIKSLKEDIHFICIGHKAPSTLPAELRDRVLKTLPMSSKTNYKKVMELAFYIEDLFQNKNFDKVSVAYNQFKSIVAYVPKIHTLLPFGEPLTSVTLKEKPIMLFDVDPHAEKLLVPLTRKAMTAHLYHTCIESLTSEQSARMMAMDSSTRNAEDMLKDLELTYHRSRQTMITNELIEIIAGAESL